MYEVTFTMNYEGIGIDLADLENMRKGQDSRGVLCSSRKMSEVELGHVGL